MTCQYIGAPGRTISSLYYWAMQGRQRKKPRNLNLTINHAANLIFITYPSSQGAMFHVYIDAGMFLPYLRIGPFFLVLHFPSIYYRCYRGKGPKPCSREAYRLQYTPLHQTLFWVRGGPIHPHPHPSLSWQRIELHKNDKFKLQISLNRRGLRTLPNNNLRHLPEPHQFSLLSIFNKVWKHYHYQSIQSENMIK